MYKKIINKFKGEKVAILGFGMEGISTYSFIRKYSDMPLTIIDKQDIRESNKEILDGDNNLNYVFGKDYLSHLNEYDLIIKSPGVILKNIDTDGLNITSQLEILLELYSNQIIGVTGTKGKSTTATLIYQILKDQGRDARLLGNIGIPIFDDIETIKDNTIIVVEMSALQLEFVKYSPHIAIITNLYEDHLDHSGSIKHYHENKLNIFKYQNEFDYMIYCSDIEPLNSYIDSKYKGRPFRIQLHNHDINLYTTYVYHDRIYLHNTELYNINSERTLIGDHNLRNIMISLTVSEILKLNLNNTINTITNFKPLKHRLERVGEYDGVIYYDDAIATIPNSTINGVMALKNVDTLIFGGMDRGIDYTELITFLNDGNVNNIICMPTTGYKVGKKVKNKSVKVIMVDTLEEAVKIAKEITEKGKICLLSPAASSYEYYKNYIEKGNAFQALVKDN